MAAVTTTIVVQFNSDTGGLSAEIDSRPTGLNGGKTSFAPGDTAFFLVFPTGDAVIDQVVASAGGVSSAGAGTYPVREVLTFANSREASLSKSYAGGGTVQWFGNNLGTITFNGSKATVPVAGVGVALVTYNASYTAYGLNAPSQINGLTNFEILVVVIGHDSAP